MTTPRHNHNPILMRRVANSGLLDRAGDFCWQVGDEGKRTLVLIIPAPNGNTCYSRWTINHANGDGCQWSWNGDNDIPTLTPSLHAVGIWHGWVRDGHLVEA